MDKIIQLPERFPTGEPTLLVVAHWDMRTQRHILEKSANEKVASPAFDYIANVQPVPGSTIILVNALGTFETYDDNKNGDGHNEFPYRPNTPPKCGCKNCVETTAKDGAWVSEEQTILHHYHSFETNGGIYTHHNNKDATKSLGKVTKAFWNPYMHRVELLLTIVNTRGPELVKRIEDGEYPAVSMGMHVRYDVCSCCGHRSPTRKEYCDHLKWAMRKIDPITGVRNCALNPNPRFFDISFVFRPADQTGYMLKKVADEVYEVRSSAELGEKVAAFETKQATVRKFADIQKIIVGETIGLRRSPEATLIKRLRDTLPYSAAAAHQEKLPEGAGENLPEVSSSIATKGAGLLTEEVLSLLMRPTGIKLSEDVFDKAAFLLPHILDVFAEHPQLLEKFSSAIALGNQWIRPELIQQLTPWLTKRATTGDWITHEYAHSGLPGSQPFRDREPAHTDPITYTDPETNQAYHTTRGALMASHDQSAKADLLRHVGISAALAAAYRGVLGGIAPGFNKAPFLLRWGVPIAAGHLTAQHFLGHGEGLPDSVVSDEGYDIPRTTELLKASSFSPAIPALNFFALVEADQAGRLPTVKTGSLSQQLLAKISEREPMCLIAQLFHQPESKLASWSNLKFTPSYDPTEPPTPDVDGFCLRLGALLVC